MPDSTPGLAVPFPLPDDALVDYPALGADLAARIEELLTAPTCRVYSSVALTVPTATNFAVPFNAERWDYGGLHDPAAPTRLTIPKAGLYLVTFGAQIAHAAAGNQCFGRIRVNGGAIWADDLMAVTAAQLQARIAMSTQIMLNPGDYLEALIYQNTGSNATLNAASPTSPELAATWLAPAAAATRPAPPDGPEDELEPAPKA